MKTAAYLLFLALLAEGSARLFLSWDRFYRRIAGDYDAFYRLEWVRRHEIQGDGMYYRFDVHHPTRGWAVKPGLSDEPAFTGKRLSSNSRGLRGKTEFGYDRLSRKHRVLFIGDSFTFGDDLNDDETYCSVLQKMLPEVEIINLGVHGYGHDQMLIYLREEGLRYHPDIVVLGFISLDLSRNILSFRDFAKPRFVLQDGRLALTNVPVPSPEEMLERELLRPKFLEVLSIARDKFRNRLGLIEKEMIDVSLAILGAMVTDIRRVGATPLFVYIPMRPEVMHVREGPAAGERFFAGFCAANPEVVCDSLTPRFVRAYQGAEPQEFFGHWSPEDNRRIAEGVCHALSRVARFDRANCSR